MYLGGHFSRILTDGKVIAQACKGNTLLRSRFEVNGQTKR